MQRIDLLIALAREDSDNNDTTSTTGIPDSSFLKWANAAQKKLHAKITSIKPLTRIFEKEYLINATAGQETYAFPADVALSTRVTKVEYSVTGLEQNLVELDLLDNHLRVNYAYTGAPYGYIRSAGNILLQCKPSTNGLIRLTYQRTIPKLELRRAVVSAVTLSSTQVTSLTLDPNQLNDDDITAITDQGYLTVVDKDGVVLMQGIPVTDIDSSTGVVSIYGSAWTFSSGETLPVGAYVCAGNFHTTHSQLPELCEDYLISFMEWRAQRRDSSDDQAGTSQELQDQESFILEALQQAEPNLQRVPICDVFDL